MNYLEVSVNSVYLRFSYLVSNKLHKDSSITFYSDNSGSIDIAFKDEKKFETIDFQDLQEALKILNTIEICNSIDQYIKVEFYKQVNKIFIEKYWTEDSVISLNENVVSKYNTTYKAEEVALDLYKRHSNKESNIVEYLYNDSYSSTI